MTSDDTPWPQHTRDSIKVTKFADNVRTSPRLYFGSSLEDPGFVAAVVRAVIIDALQQPGAAAVEVVVESDLRFTVSHTIAAAGPDRPPTHGLFLAMLDQQRWRPAAVMAMSDSTWFEDRSSGRIWRQEFAATAPVTEPQDGGSTTVPGARMTFTLDSDLVGAGTVLPRDATALRTDQAVIFTDLR